MTLWEAREVFESIVPLWAYILFVAIAVISRCCDRVREHRQKQEQSTSTGTALNCPACMQKRKGR